MKVVDKLRANADRAYDFDSETIVVPVLVAEKLLTELELQKVRLAESVLFQRASRNRLKSITRDFIANNKRLRAALSRADTDIRHWVSLANRQREELDTNLPVCPTKNGIAASVDILAGNVYALYGEVREK